MESKKRIYFLFTNSFLRFEEIKWTKVPWLASGLDGMNWSLVMPSSALVLLSQSLLHVPGQFHMPYYMVLICVFLHIRKRVLLLKTANSLQVLIAIIHLHQMKYWYQCKNGQRKVYISMYVIKSTFCSHFLNSLTVRKLFIFSIQPFYNFNTCSHHYHRKAEPLVLWSFLGYLPIPKIAIKL